MRTETGEVVSVDVDVDRGAVVTRSVDLAAAPTYRGDTERAVADVRGWLAEGRRVVVVTPGPGPAERTVELLAEHDVAARLEEALPADPDDGVVHVVCGSLAHGLVSDLRGSPCSPTTTWSGSAPPAVKRAGCRPAANVRSTRSSCRPATSWCTTSTASAATCR